ncbi:hypothetical protein [Methylophaga sp.]|uniref:hypothetical protein n=1 Tax=Methylophaga sp. TaxID=2024840 RepID=UPI003A8DDB80
MNRQTLFFFLLLASFNANAAFLNGHTITSQYYFPDTTSPANNIGNGSYLVGPGIEVDFFYMGTLDISDNTFLITFPHVPSGGFSFPSFNGFKLSDTFGTIRDFKSVSINPITNMVGFDLSRITVFADEIWVNWGGLQYTMDTIVSLDIKPSAVPIPAAAFMFAPALLGLMGLRRRAKNKVA